jgi:hypothetical protein
MIHVAGYYIPWLPWLCGVVTGFTAYPWVMDHWH